MGIELNAYINRKCITFVTFSTRQVQFKQFIACKNVNFYCLLSFFMLIYTMP